MKIESSEVLSDSVLAIEKVGNGYRLVVDMHAGSGGRVCRVLGKSHRSGEKSTRANFLLERTPLFSVSPKIITFSRDDETDAWKARAFLVMDPTIVDENDVEQLKKKMPTISGILEGVSVDVDCAYVRPGVYRIELSSSGEGLVGETEGVIEWVIEFGKYEDHFDTLWRVM
ncbi:MAG: hypothetical protein R3C03_18555 [Pirellulaceae bacterium]